MRQESIRYGKWLAAAAVALPLMTSQAWAQMTLVVDNDGQGTAANCRDSTPSFSTISAAIAAAMHGDTILVCPGLYGESINFHGKAITVKSVEGPARTIVDGGGADSVVTFVSGEGPGSVLSGFTLRNGRSGFDTPGFGEGGGIRILGTSPVVSGNIIIDNRACEGAGISVTGGGPIVQGNTIENNIQFGCSGGIGGGGISILGSPLAQILGNVIANNSTIDANGGGMSLNGAGTPTIRGNIIKGNTAGGGAFGDGGGISLVNVSDALIVGNLIFGNTARRGGGIFWTVPFGARGPRLVNNTVADNQAL